MLTFFNFNFNSFVSGIDSSTVLIITFYDRWVHHSQESLSLIIWIELNWIGHDYSLYKSVSKLSLMVKLTTSVSRASRQISNEHRTYFDCKWKVCEKKNNKEILFLKALDNQRDNSVTFSFYWLVKKVMQWAHKRPVVYWRKRKWIHFSCTFGIDMIDVTCRILLPSHQILMLLLRPLII